MNLTIDDMKMEIAEMHLTIVAMRRLLAEKDVRIAELQKQLKPVEPVAEPTKA